METYVHSAAPGGSILDMFVDSPRLLGALVAAGTAVHDFGGVASKQRAVLRERGLRLFSRHYRIPDVQFRPRRLGAAVG